MNYQDQWTRYHHKPTDGINPSSGNGWVYTAYASKSGLPVDNHKLGECFNLCRIDSSTLIRNPGILDGSPISRDEILGMISLELLKPKKDVIIGWNFSPYPLPKFSLTKLIKQLWELRPSLISEDWVKLIELSGSKVIKLPKGINIEFTHRNYFWQNNLDQLYRFAFSVPVQDRYVILKTWDKFQWYKPSHIFYAAISQLDKLGRASGIRFLKYGGEKNRKEMEKEFPADHPIVLAGK